jgi:predicted transcriptional regulator
MTITTSSSKAYATTRDKTQLIASILKAANGRSVNAAQIMYSAFLSHTQIKQYLSILIYAGLIKYQEGNRRTYRISDKGMRFLYLYDEISKLLNNSSSDANIIH